MGLYYVVCDVAYAQPLSSRVHDLPAARTTAEVQSCIHCRMHCSRSSYHSPPPEQILINDRTVYSCSTVQTCPRYRWAYASTYTLVVIIPMHEIGHNRHKKGVGLYYIMGVYDVFYVIDHTES